MITGVLIYEDDSCEVFVERIVDVTHEAIDNASREFLDSVGGAFINLTYVDDVNCTLTHSEELA